ncbi:RNA-binding protein [Chitinivorax tropicus]|uniref:RNA-binding protein n=1 Tax=Chitinivorax tropicus TaxID=714531 RepID=A0A840MVL2_9PROT|nr:ribosome assembly RNA-binding protein YhbY [Chitinivorax tropicus]MBB5019211.1 RNA-binding protein [Chitinivorax tropicus]
MIELTPLQRRFLRAQAHHLNPTVMIGANGLTEAVMRELARSLDAHELIKVRVFSDERDTREALLQQICDDLDCAPIQHIGKLLVLYRPGNEPKIELPDSKQAINKPTVKAVDAPAKKPATKPIASGRPGGNRRRRTSR